MRIIVTGVTRTGNLGGAAMLCAVEEVLRPASSDIALASILPRSDKEQHGPDACRIIDAGYRFLLLVIFPLCLALWPLRKAGSIRRLMARLPLMREMAQADAVADLSGIAFVDGRGLPLLLYNVAVVLPALFMGVPVYKLSQAVGPFARTLNGLAARWTLRRCRSVAARGAISFGHLKQLELSNISQSPDVSFALTLGEQARKEAFLRIGSAGLRPGERPLVICSPSAVVRSGAEAVGVDLCGIIAQVLGRLQEQGCDVALLPHSADTGIRKNDDWAVARMIRDTCAANGKSVPMIDPGHDPRVARAAIAYADMFIASRFHSMIAALSQSVPTITVGWSHKYAEAAEPFGMNNYTMDYASLTANRLFDMATDVLRRRKELKQGMQPAAERARHAAIEGIAVLLPKASHP